MSKTSEILWSIVVALLCVVLLGIYGVKVFEEDNPPYEKDGVVVIFSGDKVVKRINLKDNSVFVVKDEAVYYTDSAQEGFYKADYTDLSKLGKGHRKIVRQERARL